MSDYLIYNGYIRVKNTATWPDVARYILEHKAPYGCSVSDARRFQDLHPYVKKLVARLRAFNNNASTPNQASSHIFERLYKTPNQIVYIPNSICQGSGSEYLVFLKPREKKGIKQGTTAAINIALPAGRQYRQPMVVVVGSQEELKLKIILNNGHLMIEVTAGKKAAIGKKELLLLFREGSRQVVYKTEIEIIAGEIQKNISEKRPIKKTYKRRPQNRPRPRIRTPRATPRPRVVIEG